MGSPWYTLHRGGPSPHKISKRDTDRVGNQEKVGEPWITYSPLVPLDASAFHSRPVGKLLLGQARVSPERGNPVAEFGSPGEDPVGVRVAAVGHSTNALARLIMGQYPNGRYIAI